MIKKSHFVSTLVIQKRKKLKMSQTVLSSRLGWSNKNAQYLSDCELGKNPFPVKHILNISSALWIDKSIIIDAMTSDYNLCLKKETEKQNENNK